MMPNRLNVHIKELVLEGLDGIDPNLLGSAVEHELERLFARRGIPPALGTGGTATSAEGDTLGGAEGGAVTMASRRDSGAVGAHIARAIYGGLNR